MGKLNLEFYSVRKYTDVEQSIRDIKSLNLSSIDYLLNCLCAEELMHDTEMLHNAVECLNTVLKSESDDYDSDDYSIIQEYFDIGCVLLDKYNYKYAHRYD